MGSENCNSRQSRKGALALREGSHLVGKSKRQNSTGTNGLPLLLWQQSS